MVFWGEVQRYPCPTRDAGHFISAAPRCWPWTFRTRSGPRLPDPGRCVMSPEPWVRATFRIARHLPNISVLFFWLSGWPGTATGLHLPVSAVGSGFRPGAHPAEHVSGGTSRRRWRRHGTFRHSSVRFRVRRWLWSRIGCSPDPLAAVHLPSGRHTGGLRNGGRVRRQALGQECRVRYNMKRPVTPLPGIGTTRRGCRPWMPSM